MEAACIAAMRGHTVELYEASDSLGGQLKAAALPPTRQELHCITEYLNHQLKKYDVRIHLNTEVNEEIVKNLQTDVVIIATGAQPTIPQFLSGNKKVFPAQDVILSKANVGKGRIGVIGGGLVGCETADFLAEQGNEVVLFEMVSDICPDAGKATSVYLEDKLRDLEVQIKTGAKVMKIDDDTLYYESEGKENTVSGIDSFVIAMGYSPDNSLGKLFEHTNIPYFEIGDCKKVADAMESIHNAFWLAMSL
jgi:NADPH-dependent 2,4-dienoyl-CoA reductase/sulfur reductase-like enzyme